MNNSPEQRSAFPARFPSRGLRALATGLGCSVLLGTAGPGLAADTDFSEWKCARCDFPTGLVGDIEVSGVYVSDDAARHGDYTGLDEDGGYLDVHNLLRWWSDGGSFWELEGRNVGLESRTVTLNGGKPGLYDFEVFYDKLPRYIHDDTVTVFSGAGSDDLLLPAGWTRGINTSNMPGLGAALNSSDTEYDRETLGMGLELLHSTRWKANIDYRHIERDGQYLQSGNFLTTSTILPLPVDDSTDQMDAGIAYTADSWNLQLGYHASVYDNDNSALRWDNPFTGVPGSDLGQKSLSPDNEFHQLSLTGAARVLGHTVISGSVSTGKMEQDENFLPYTVNPAIATQALPTSSLDAEVDTTNINLRVQSNPIPKLRLSAEYLRDDRDNDSDRYTFDWVDSDSAQVGPRVNKPFDFTRDKYSVEGNYRLNPKARVYLGYDHDEWDRSLQERDDTETDRVWGRFRIRPTGRVDINATAGVESRDGSNYQAVQDPAAQQNPLMRKYNMADRDRVDFDVYMSVTPTDRINTGLRLEVAEDDYDDSDIGLTESDYVNVALDGSVALQEGRSVYAMYSYEEITSRQRNSQTFSTADWKARTRDKFDTLVLGLRWPQLIDRLDVDLGYTYAKSEGRTRVDFSTIRDDFPDNETDLKSLKLNASYRLRDNLKMGLGLWYEDYDSDDWAIDGVDPATISNVLTQGQDSYDYDVTTVMLTFSYELGAVGGGDEE